LRLCEHLVASLLYLVEKPSGLMALSPLWNPARWLAARFHCRNNEVSCHHPTRPSTLVPIAACAPRYECWRPIGATAVPPLALLDVGGGHHFGVGAWLLALDRSPEPSPLDVFDRPAAWYQACPCGSNPGAPTRSRGATGSFSGIDQTQCQRERIRSTSRKSIRPRQRRSSGRDASRRRPASMRIAPFSAL